VGARGPATNQESSLVSVGLQNQVQL